MNGQARSTSPLRATLVAAVAAVVLVLALPGTGAYAAWNASAPLGVSSVTTGSLGLDRDALPGGTWSNAGDAFDPETDRLTAGTTLSYTIADVPVTAMGDNLRATFTVAGAQVPAAVADHVTVTVASDPSTVLGADSDADGHQAVTLVVTLTADASLPSGTQTIDLTDLVVTLTNGHAWTDTAALDAGTITTGSAPAPGGTVAFDFDLGLDADRTLCLYLTEPDATINWRDYASGAGETAVLAVDGRNCHTYVAGTTGQAYVTVTGTFQGLGSPTQTVAEIGALKGVNQWTDAVGTTSAAYAFFNAVNMIYINGAPSTITDFSYAFANASTATTQEFSVNGLRTANVTTMAHMFDGAGSINWWSIVSASAPWDTSNVTDMSGMFRNSTIGAHNLRFDTSNVTDMSSMFQGAATFSGSVDQWDTSRVEDMSSMFEGAAAFNGNLNSTGGHWDVSQVTDMSAMFRGASTFNGDITAWDTSSVTDMSSMFEDAVNFNGNLGSWSRTGNVTTMSRMFMNADAFNADLVSWDTGSVTDLSFMFAETANFHGDVRTWDLSSVTTTAHMFQNSAFDYYSLGAWGGDPVWDVSHVQDLSFMFAGARYNHSLAGWDLSSATDVTSMFQDATNFNQDLSSWVVRPDVVRTDFNTGANPAWVANPAWQPPWGAQGAALAPPAGEDEAGAGTPTDAVPGDGSEPGSAADEATTVPEDTPDSVADTDTDIGTDDGAAQDLATEPSARPTVAPAEEQAE